MIALDCKIIFWSYDRTSGKHDNSDSISYLMEMMIQMSVASVIFGIASVV